MIISNYIQLREYVKFYMRNCTTYIMCTEVTEENEGEEFDSTLIIGIIIVEKT